MIGSVPGQKGKAGSVKVPDPDGTARGAKGSRNIEFGSYLQTWQGVYASSAYYCKLKVFSHRAGREGFIIVGMRGSLGQGVIMMAVLAAAASLGVFSAKIAVAQAATPASGPLVTNTFTGEPSINIRSGPSTILYPVPCGLLELGGTLPAVGSSPMREWVAVALASCPNGVGWVYAANVALSGTVPIIEIPATPTYASVGPVDPTLVAAFHGRATATRLPTFTPPPALRGIPAGGVQPVRPLISAGIAILLAGAVGILAATLAVAGRG